MLTLISITLCISILIINLILFTTYKKNRNFKSEYYMYLSKSLSDQIGITINIEKSPNLLTGKTFGYSCIFSLAVIMTAILFPFGPLLSENIMMSLNNGIEISTDELIVIFTISIFIIYIPSLFAYFFAIHLSRSNKFRRATKMKIYKSLGKAGMRDKMRRDYFRTMLNNSIRTACKDISEIRL